MTRSLREVCVAGARRVRGGCAAGARCVRGTRLRPELLPDGARLLPRRLVVLWREDGPRSRLSRLYESVRGWDGMGWDGMRWDGTGCESVCESGACQPRYRRATRPPRDRHATATRPPRLQACCRGFATAGPRSCPPSQTRRTPPFPRSERRRICPTTASASGRRSARCPCAAPRTWRATSRPRPEHKRRAAGGVGERTRAGDCHASAAGSLEAGA